MVCGITNEVGQLVNSFYALDEGDARGWFSHYLKIMVNPKYRSHYELWMGMEKKAVSRGIKKA